MKETVIWNHERMPIIDGMPAKRSRWAAAHT